MTNSVRWCQFFLMVQVLATQERLGIAALTLVLAGCVAAYPAWGQTAPPSVDSESLAQFGAPAQLVQPTSAGQAAPPATITLQDALEHAQKNDAQFLSAVTDAKLAKEDRLQARDMMLPSLSDSTQFLGTQGNGKTAEGRFVTNDGVHVYRQWAVAREDLSPNTYLLTGYRRAAAVQALVNAKQEIARRGLTVTVTKAYYAMIVAQRKYATGQRALAQAKHFLDVSQDLERAGEAAHGDVIKSEIQYGQLQQAFQDEQLAMEDARLDLAVLLFPALNENFTVVDDLDSPRALPQFPEVETMARQQNPDLRVAEQNLRASELDVSAAKGAFLPSIFLETDYGIEANDFALRAVPKAHPDLGPLPTLGYFATASLTFPVWDWGTLRSKLHQAEYKQQQAHTELSQAQRQVLSNLYSFYNEASVAQAAVVTARRTAELAAESLRLSNLRYQSGEATSLEAVDAQNTLTAAQNALDDAESRYRVALANLQTLTGNF